MQVGGLLQKFSKAKAMPSLYKIQLSADETNLIVGRTTLNVLDITEIRQGQKTMVFNKQKSVASTFPENLSFSIMYGIMGKNTATADGNSIDLVAGSELEYSMWISGLKMLVDRKLDPELSWIKATWRKLKKPEINLRQTIDLLSQVNFQAPRRVIHKEFIELDKEGRKRINLDGFLALLDKLRERSEIRELFNKYATNNLFLAPAKLADFLMIEQKESRTLEECHNLILEYSEKCRKQRGIGLSSNLKHVRLTFKEFENFLKSKHNHIMHDYCDQLTQDMTRPIAEYWIASSHNTYLEGHQLKGVSSTEQYIRVLKMGCRCIELDCWDGDDGNPIIYHGHTLTKKVSFEAVVQAINDYAFYTSPYPLTLSLENHCSVEQQDKMAEIFTRIFGDKLAVASSRTQTDNVGCLPSPHYLREKILLKGKMLLDVDAQNPKFYNFEQQLKDGDVVPEEEDITDAMIEMDPIEEETKKAQISKQKISDKLSEIIFMKSISFPGFEKKVILEPWEMCSFSESKALSIFKSHHRDFIGYNCHNISRIYPAGTRFASSNYDPFYPWGMGCQMVALNYQTIGIPMWMNEAMFNQQGKCGYILKPPFLRGKERVPVHKYSSITITILSARQLPKSKEGEIISPFVNILLRGHKADTTEFKTQIQNNGYCPAWNETVTFPLKSSSFAFLIFLIINQGDGKRIGHFSVCVESLRPGYRILPLYNDQYREIPSCNLFCHIDFDEPGKEKAPGAAPQPSFLPASLQSGTPKQGRRSQVVGAPEDLSPSQDEPDDPLPPPNPTAEVL
uniref:Phosphoinositide phospholipase C n=1 Tax=Arcella intermedia TaxID=1963864 RepID=A0A6B2KYF1_9EUKA